MSFNFLLSANRLSIEENTSTLLSPSAFEKFVAFISGKMTKPKLYGWFHVLSLLAILILCALAILNRHKVTEKSMRLSLLFTGISMMIFETYKQIVFAYSPETDTWAYNWSAFPFQFCSTPMYVMVVAALVKKGAFQDSLLAFLATYSLVAGGGVVLYPATVFTETIGINLQTMFHHGAQAVVAVYLLSSGVVKFQLKTILKGALPVFAVLVVAAITMNSLFSIYGNGADFNMFYLAPGKDFLLPILDKIFAGLPHFCYVFSYLFFFTLAAYLVLFFSKSIVCLYQKYKTEISKETR